MIAQGSSVNLAESDGWTQLEPSDLEQIVLLAIQAGLDSQPTLPGKPLPFQIVWYAGRPYKVRAYAGGDAAQQKLELMDEAKDFFVKCYGRIDRYLVLEYINDGGPHDDSPQALAKLGSYLAELATIPTRRLPERDFDSLCKEIAAADFFLPQTIELARSYYRRNAPPALRLGLEHFDALPMNFITTEQGNFVSIDEKHLEVGPCGVSLIGAMLLLPQEQFSKIKEAYLAKVSFAPFDDPQYREFLLFYHLIYLLAFQAVNKSPQVNLWQVKWYWLHRHRHLVLQLIGASMIMRLREEPPWHVQYHLNRSGKFIRRAWRFLKRRGGTGAMSQGM